MSKKRRAEKKKLAEAAERAIERYNKELEELKKKPLRFMVGRNVRRGVSTIHSAYLLQLGIEEYYNPSLTVPE